MAQRQRIEQPHLAAEPQHGVEVALIKTGQRQHVGEEQRVELARLQDARDVLVIVRLQEPVVGPRMPPHAVMVRRGAGQQESHQVHLAASHYGSP